LRNPLNRDAVRWYLQQVHPLLLDLPRYRFLVAGNASGSPAAAALADQLRQAQRTLVYLDQNDLEPLYNDSAVIVNPMQRGSGVKMKTLHALQKGLPLVTTTVGAEGTGIQDFNQARISDDPRQFADAIRDLLANPDHARALTQQATTFLSARYDAIANLAALLKFPNEVPS
jgi:glycosyltransferase involved in cell wall biosynthesis